MNDQGLFYDGTSGPWKEVVKSSGKPQYRSNLSGKILEECATVPEAIALLKKYNLSYFRNGQMLLADKFGNSAIVEGDTIIYGVDSYQIATNFYHSNPSLGGYPCHRYDIAETMITNLPSLSVDTMRIILQSVHLEGYSYTQYSTIHDLANLTVYYFKDSDFKNLVKIDLKKELQKGERWYETKDFFAVNPVVKTVPGKTTHFKTLIKNAYDNKVVKCSLKFSNDLLNGSCEGFYRNGQTSWRATFDHGRMIGTLNHWKETGKPALGYEFLDANQTNIVDYFPEGALLLKVTLNKVDEDGIVPSKIVTYNEDGTLSYRGTFKNSLFFFENESKPYSGQLSTYYKNGERITLIEYKAGKLHGERKRWDQKGNIIDIETYRNGILTAVERH